MTQEMFVSKARQVHGNQYLYDNMHYINMRHKVLITCRIHGDFEQLPQAHLKGQGCPICGKEKQKQTMLERYGVDNPMKNKSFCEKARETCLSRYGYEWARSNKDVQAKCESTNLQKYGVRIPLQNDEIREKMQNTVESRYGKSFVGQVPEIRDRVHQTCLERYGTEEPLASPVIREKICMTNQERYGGNTPLSSDEIREKVRSTCLSKYGVCHVTQSDTVIKKILFSKSQNGTFGTSKSEELLYRQLCERFGINDVLRQYSSDEYPFACDFYIKSRNLYIELNASWTHGEHWFSDKSENDTNTLRTWNDRNTAYYKNAVHVWTVADVKKRDIACNNCLNYVVFWDEQLRDAELWFASGSPDGHDWDEMYQWLPNRYIQDMHFMGTLTGTLSNLSLVAKMYQFKTFYKHEIEMWNNNEMFRGLSLQMWLYINRWKYLGKLPVELTDFEILRGFTIAGIHKGFTVFDATLMDKVITKYNIKSVYDPCAGWGERMLYCYCHDISYLGVDINQSLKYGYDKMINDFNITGQKVVFKDSALYEPIFTADAVVTCPPYGSLEQYSDNGAETLDDSSFLMWWYSVVKHAKLCNVKYFCFQINQAWKDKMVSVVEDNGFHFVKEFLFDNIKSGHFTRKNGKNQKREFESMIVLSCE